MQKYEISPQLHKCLWYQGMPTDHSGNPGYSFNELYVVVPLTALY